MEPSPVGTAPISPTLHATCHPEAAESSASPRTPNEGPMQLAATTPAAGKPTGPSASKKRISGEDADETTTPRAPKGRHDKAHGVSLGEAPKRWNQVP